MPANTTPRRSAPTFAIAAATAPVIAPLRSLPSGRPRKLLLALALVWIWLPALGNADTIGPFNPIGPFGVQVWGNGLNGSNYLGLAVQVVAGQVATAGSSTDGTSSANADFFGAQTVGVSGGTTGFFFAQATAQLWDTVTFSNFLPGQSASVNMILTNSFLGNFASGSEELLVKIGNTMQFADGTTSQLGGIRNLSVTFPLVNDVPTYFFAELSVQAPWYSTGAQLSDPLTFTLPAGVTYTTASGFQEFSPEAPPPPPPPPPPPDVPEPASLLQVLPASAVLAYFARRRKKT